MVDLTPAKPVLIAGQFHARISEGVMDPITATVLVIESVRRSESHQAVSCVEESWPRGLTNGLLEISGIRVTGADRQIGQNTHRLS